MKILVFDTSTDACSAALMHNDAITECFEVAPQKHTELILPMIDSLLSAASLELSQLDALAFGCGPGSFTGVRLATSVAQALAFGAKINIIRLSTLQVLAQAVFEKHGTTNVLVAQDARMHEIYYGAYAVDASGIMQPIIEDALSKPESINIPFSNNDWAVVGSGWSLYANLILTKFSPSKVFTDIYPQAKYMLQLAATKFLNGEAISPENAVPVYLRNEVAWK